MGAATSLLAGCAFIEAGGQGRDFDGTREDTVIVTVQPPPVEKPVAPQPPAASTPTARPLPPTLFCRDLFALGFSYDESLAYWFEHGKPARMDADTDGIPCETVYPASDVLAHFAATPEPTVPEGTLHILGPVHGNYGQSPRAGNCSIWTLRFVNDSDTTVDKLEFSPRSASYTHDQTLQEVPAEPRLEVVVVSLQPGQARDIVFPTCTSTPHPGADYTFAVQTPVDIRFTWANGTTGTTSII